MEERIKRTAEAVSRMEQYLEIVLPRKKSWGNTYIKKQIDFEAMDIVREIADTLNEHVVEVDYTLWSYCAKGYGEICTSKRPRCCECVIRGYCSQGREKPCQKIQA